MKCIPKTIARNLSLRISLMVVYGLALLAVTLVAMFHYVHQALKDEAMSNAQQTLDGTVQQIDNILLSVEQTAGNIYYDMMSHLDQPERMHNYSRRMVESSPYIVGCAIVFKPDYYPGHHLFMAYVHRSGHTPATENILVSQDTFTDKPYTEQRWYTEPMTFGRPCWIDPLKNEEAEGEPLGTFCLPIYDNTRECVGVLAVDIRIELLSEIILSVKPSPNGYATLLARNGSYIVHPDSDKLLRQTVYAQLSYGADDTVKEVAEAMVHGETGQKSFDRDGQKWRVFYKPFERTEVPGRTKEKLSWSVGVVYPVDDIYGEYNKLFYYLLSGVTIALLILFLLCWLVIHKQLKPLEMLTKSAQRIASGNYEEPIPDTNRVDEIGQLQENFNRVQQSLAAYLGRQEKLNTMLKERGDMLAEAYSNVQKNSKIKTMFLHHMTNQMIEPTERLGRSVTMLCNNYDTMSEKQTGSLVARIEEQSRAIVELTDKMLQTADNDMGKEDGDD